MVPGHHVAGGVRAGGADGRVDEKHGRTLKGELESGARSSVANDNWWGLFLLVAIAVAREGSETVVFLYGTVAAGEGGSNMLMLALAGVAGFVVALLTFWLLQLGGKLITWRRFSASPKSCCCCWPVRCWWAGWIT